MLSTSCIAEEMEHLRYAAYEGRGSHTHTHVVCTSGVVHKKKTSDFVKVSKIRMARTLTCGIRMLAALTTGDPQQPEITILWYLSHSVFSTAGRLGKKKFYFRHSVNSNIQYSLVVFEKSSKKIKLSKYFCLITTYYLNSISKGNLKSVGSEYNPATLLEPNYTTDVHLYPLHYL